MPRRDLAAPTASLPVLAPEPSPPPPGSSSSAAPAAAPAQHPRPRQCPAPSPAETPVLAPQSLTTPTRRPSKPPVGHRPNVPDPVTKCDRAACCVSAQCRRYDRQPTVRCPLPLRPRTGRYGAGWPRRWARSWQAWRTGTPAPAGGGADADDRREQGVLPEIVALPPGDLIQQVRFGPAMKGCRGEHCVLELRVLPAAEPARWRNASPGKVLSRGCRDVSPLTSSKTSASRASLPKRANLSWSDLQATAQA